MDVCAICQEEARDSCLTIECGHTYHAACISTWFRRGNTTCPSCRSEPPTLPIMDAFTRASLLRKKYKRSTCPELKRLVEALRRAENKYSEKIRAYTIIKREHRETIQIVEKARRSRWLAARAVRRQKRTLGNFSSSEFPLHLLQASWY